jgi:hypothetical protein
MNESTSSQTLNTLSDTPKSPLSTPLVYIAAILVVVLITMILIATTLIYTRKESSVAPNTKITETVIITLDKDTWNVTAEANLITKINESTIQISNNEASLTITPSFNFALTPNTDNLEVQKRNISDRELYRITVQPGMVEYTDSSKLGCVKFRNGEDGGNTLPDYTCYGHSIVDINLSVTCQAVDIEDCDKLLTAVRMSSSQAPALPPKDIHEFQIAQPYIRFQFANTVEMESWLRPSTGEISYVLMPVNPTGSYPSQSPGIELVIKDNPQKMNIAGWLTNDLTTNVLVSNIGDIITTARQGIMTAQTTAVLFGINIDTTAFDFEDKVLVVTHIMTNVEKETLVPAYTLLLNSLTTSQIKKI